MAVTIKYLKMVTPPKGGWPSTSSHGNVAPLSDGKVGAFSNALNKKKSKTQPDADYPPWDLPPGYTILEALRDYATNNWQGRELWLIAVSGDMQYKVIAYDMASKRCQLESEKGLRIKPVISEREVPLYTPFWR
jgi:hypothetical protein